MSNIAGLFFEAAERHPDRTAIIHRDRSITYGELAAQVRSTAANFRHRGLVAGDRVLVFVPMGVDLYRVVLALFSLGVGAVFLDAWVGRKRMELCCRQADCRGLVGGWKVRTWAWLSRPLRRIPIRIGTALPVSAPAGMATVDGEDTALITFTTGSTGAPKAARRSHAFLAAQFDALLDELDPSPEDVVMTTLPIVLFMNLGIGCVSVIPDFRPARPAAFNGVAVAQELGKHRVTRTIASPTQVLAIAEHLLRSGIRLPELRSVITGGAAVFPVEAATMHKAFPLADTRIVFGSTECEPISSIRATDLVARHMAVHKGLCVGDIFHRTALRIIRITDRALPELTTAELDNITLPGGSIGEIIVSGDHVLRTYHNNEEAFRRNKIVVAGTVWHRTGDSGYVDEEGRLFLMGRCAQLIRCGDALLSPFVWEDKLRRHPGVDKATLMELRGVVTAIILPEAGADRTGLRASLLAAHGELAAVVFIADMPMDPRHQSKIDHDALRRLLGA